MPDEPKAHSLGLLLAVPGLQRYTASLPPSLSELPPRTVHTVWRHYPGSDWPLLFASGGVSRGPWERVEEEMLKGEVGKEVEGEGGGEEAEGGAGGERAGGGGGAMVAEEKGGAAVRWRQALQLRRESGVRNEPSRSLLSPHHLSAISSRGHPDPSDYFKSRMREGCQTESAQGQANLVFCQ
eukprot:669841-Rhodomonas_salina.2